MTRCLMGIYEPFNYCGEHKLMQKSLPFRAFRLTTKVSPPVYPVRPIWAMSIIIIVLIWRK
jgi:hypothetical protein